MISVILLVATVAIFCTCLYMYCNFKQCKYRICVCSEITDLLTVALLTVFLNADYNAMTKIGNEDDVTVLGL